MIHYFSLPGLSNCFLYLFKLIGSTWPSSLDETSDMLLAHAPVWRKEDFSCLFFLFVFVNRPISISVSIKSEGCWVIPAPTAGERAHLPFLEVGGWGGGRRMKIDLLQVNSQSFSAKGQGESALTANRTHELRVCFLCLKVL